MDSLDTTPMEITTSDAPMDNTTPETKEIRLVDVPVTDGTVALNLMASFLNLAQRRGTFGLDESAKIWECLKLFAVNETAPVSA